MRMMNLHRLTFVMPLILALATALPAAAAARGAQADVPAAEAISRAVNERLGGSVEVEVLTLALPDGAGDRFVEAKPDPSGRLGRPIRFTLVPAHGSVVTATATLRVVGEHVVAARDLLRATTIAGGDVVVVRGELTDMPIRRVPESDQVMGSRVLRPVPSGSVLLPGSVLLRRAVEPGDRITAVAIAGDIEVSASMTATDGGDPGDVIRVVNTDTRRSLRARVIDEGMVEVGYER